MATQHREGSGRNQGGRGRARTGRSSGARSERSSGVMDMARERPVAAAAVAAGAAAAGVFLWSKRSQISNQLSNLSDQIGAWTETMTGSASPMLASGDDSAGLTTSQKSAARSRPPRSGMSETGAGNASPGRASGGGGTSASATGRGRAQAGTALSH